MDRRALYLINCKTAVIKVSLTLVDIIRKDSSVNPSFQEKHKPYRFGH